MHWLLLGPQLSKLERKYSTFKSIYFVIFLYC